MEKSLILLTIILIIFLFLNKNKKIIFSYWIGLENLYYLTNDHSTNMRVDMTDSGSSVWAKFSTF